MADYQTIYNTRAADYHALIRAEDAAGAVTGWLAAQVLPKGADVLDVGAGTGRVAAMLAALDPTARITCTDGAEAMLEELKRQWVGPLPKTQVADYRALPFENQSFDIVTAGWALGHLTGFYPETWPDEAAKALDELDRVARPGASIIIFETLGTGHAVAAPPRESLRQLYAAFEARGMVRSVLNTDYRFESPEEALRLVQFFFGDRVVAALHDVAGVTTLTEWTGAWTRQKI